jgi:CxxC motif-containing protein
MDRKELTCIICPTSCQIKVSFAADGSGQVESVEGHRCSQGDKYVRNEVSDPVRALTTLCRLEGGSLRMCPVRTDIAVPKDILEEMAEAVSQIVVKAPVRVGDIVIKGIMGTKANIVVTRDID